MIPDHQSSLSLPLGSQPGWAEMVISIPCQVADRVTLGNNLASLGPRVGVRSILKMEYGIHSTEPEYKKLCISINRNRLYLFHPLPAPRVWFLRGVGAGAE